MNTFNSPTVGPACRQLFLRPVSLCVFIMLGTLMGSLAAATGDVQALFNLADPAIGPFPSNQFTILDNSQITGRRIALPKPDCTRQPSTCDDIEILNTLDGFSMQPRIGIAFNGAIDPNSVSSKSVFVVENSVGAAPRVIGINEIVWDPQGNVLYVTTDELLSQRTTYVVIVTKGILNTAGKPVQASSEFTAFLGSGTGEYRDRLREGIDAAVAAGTSRDSVVVASTFTTLSATATLEKMRDQVRAAAPPSASFVSEGKRTVYPRSAVASMTMRYQMGVSPPVFGDNIRAINAISALFAEPGDVGTFAFGSFASPNYLTREIVIPQVGTLTGTPAVQGTNTLLFALALPAGTPPAKGWPVAIIGHGNGQPRELMYAFSAILAKRGIATIAINAPGHGFGPLSTMDLKLTTNETVSLPSGGRGVDVNGNGTIDNNEGNLTAGRPYALLNFTNAFQQTVVDLLQLVRVIQSGIDVDGDGKVELDSGSIYYMGTSAGAHYGTMFVTMEPAVRAAALTFGGYPRTDSFRLGVLARPMQSTFLQQRVPSLLNGPGITQIGGQALAAPYFNENKPMRNVPPVTNDVAGAMEIQEVFARQLWSGQPGDPGVYAPHLQKKPLDGMGARSVLVQIAKGDLNVPTAASMAWVRAGGLEKNTTYCRVDLIYAKTPGLPLMNPHQTHLYIGSPLAILDVVARGLQEQVATFFASNGTTIVQAEPAEYFETPIKLPTAENIEYITLNPGVQVPVDSASSGKELSPGSLFTVFGTTNTPSADQGVASGPLPTTLGGVMVSVNGRAVPLSYTGKGQVNGQIPYETVPGAGTTQLVTYGISGAILPIQVSALAPRLFIADGNRCLAQNEDGALNSASNPAKAGRYVGVYVIGLGPVNPFVATGMPARSVPMSLPSGTVTALMAGRRITPSFAGMIPGYVGVGEVDLLIPADMPAGDPGFSITVGTANSNTCQIAVVK